MLAFIHVCLLSIMAKFLSSIFYLFLGMQSPDRFSKVKRQFRDEVLGKVPSEIKFPLRLDIGTFWKRLFIVSLLKPSE